MLHFILGNDNVDFYTVHGRQYVKRGNDQIVFNVAKISKLSSMSLRDGFELAQGDDGEVVYKCAADMMGRTLSITNEKEQLIAQMAKTKKALIQTAAFGSGSESTIDIAPGVDCSTILAAIFAIGQVGEHCKSYNLFRCSCASEINPGIISDIFQTPVSIFFFVFAL